MKEKRKYTAIRIYDYFPVHRGKRYARNLHFVVYDADYKRIFKKVIELMRALNFKTSRDNTIDAMKFQEEEI